jgi:ankyrin repeat protein
MLYEQAEAARQQQRDYLNQFAIAKQEKEDYLRDLSEYYIGQAILANKYKVDALIQAEIAQQNTMDYLEQLTGAIQDRSRPPQPTAPAIERGAAQQQAMLAGSRTDRLLLRAQQQIAERRLIKPKGDSALSTYQQILQLEPGHPEALAGIEFIMDKYLSWAEYAASQGNPSRAQYFFEQAMQVDPNNANLAQKVARVRQQLQAVKTAAGQVTPSAPTDPKALNLSATPQLIEALLQSVQLGDAQSVATLLSSGAPADVADRRGETALLIAARNGHVQVVDQLLRRGAKINRSNAFGETPLMVAAQSGQLAVVERLLQDNAALDSKDADGRTALINAASNGHYPIAQQLLEKGADPNSKNAAGRTALMAAAWNGHIDVVQLLLGFGVDIDAKNNDGWTALSHAAWQGQAEVVRLLLTRGANDTPNKDGQTARMMASSRGHLNVVELLQ